MPLPGWTALRLAVAMIDPPSSIRRAACLMVSIGPVRLTPSTRVHSARSRSTTGPIVAVPALAKAMCRAPKRSTAVAASRATSSSAVTSQRTVATASPSSVATAASPVSSMSPTTTRAPSATNRLVVASPMPEAPPVTSAIRPASRPSRRRPSAAPSVVPSPVVLLISSPIPSVIPSVLGRSLRRRRLPGLGFGPHGLDDAVPPGEALGDPHVERADAPELEHLDALGPGGVGVGRAPGHEEPAARGHRAVAEAGLAGHDVVEAVGRGGVAGGGGGWGPPPPNQRP